MHLLDGKLGRAPETVWFRWRQGKSVFPADIETRFLDRLAFSLVT
jgi:hypothetical protein